MNIIIQMPHNVSFQTDFFQISKPLFPEYIFQIPLFSNPVFFPSTGYWNKFIIFKFIHYSIIFHNFLKPEELNDIISFSVTLVFFCKMLASENASEPPLRCNPRYRPQENSNLVLGIFTNFDIWIHLHEEKSKALK